MRRSLQAISIRVGRDDKWEQRAIGNLTTPDLNGPRPAPFSGFAERPEGMKSVSPQRGPRILRAERGAKRSGAIFAPVSGATEAPAGIRVLVRAPLSRSGALRREWKQISSAGGREPGRDVLGGCGTQSVSRRRSEQARPGFGLLFIRKRITGYE